MTGPANSGFNCTGCGKYHMFGSYVLAHSSVALVHTCDQCGRRHEVKNFVVTVVPERVKRRRS